jgi:hypothetical protein
MHEMAQTILLDKPISSDRRSRAVLKVLPGAESRLVLRIFNIINNLGSSGFR